MEKKAVTIVLLAGWGFLLGFLAAWLEGRIGRAWYAVAVTAAIAIAILVRRLVRQLALRSVLKSGGKFSRGLLVYSDSPLWTNHIESKWIPAFGAKLVVWKLSSERSWQTCIRRLFLKGHISGSLELNLPMALIYAERKDPSLLQFHNAFLDLKFGDEEALRNSEKRLARELGTSPSRGSTGGLIHSRC